MAQAHELHITPPGLLSLERIFAATVEPWTSPKIRDTPRSDPHPPAGPLL
ncbi:hypothetical protein MAMP_02302 [Methylophaga aminisulfidivorans MP]|uniref:Uncharacterized protein n=1 Tax=Methylophaga aminisulfidivorans MP TaxID=1026882 RepID=F5SXS9_9GAMM|nr:hypothetical protein MAMP_02302 [Methylophaga aminisulfidivorans MP]